MSAAWYEIRLMITIEQRIASHIIHKVMSPVMFSLFSGVVTLVLWHRFTRTLLLSSFLRYHNCGKPSGSHAGDITQHLKPQLVSLQKQPTFGLSILCALHSINQSINLFVNLSVSQSKETVNKIHDRTPRKIQIFTYWCPPPIK